MSKPIVFGITGGSGSGKTLFMKKLKAKFPHASIHSMYNYYLHKDQQLKDRNNIENFDLLNSIDIRQYVQHLKK